jgi:hypothetical protein
VRACLALPSVCIGCRTWRTIWRPSAWASLGAPRIRTAPSAYHCSSTTTNMRHNVYDIVA